MRMWPANYAQRLLRKFPAWRYVFIAVPVSVFIVSALISEQLSAEHDGGGTTTSARELISSEIQRCENSEGNASSCYKALASTVMQKYSISSALNAIRQYETQQGNFYGCHTFLHFYGRLAKVESGSIGDALSQGSPACFAGYYHGVLEKHFLESGLTSASPNSTFRDMVSGLCQRSQFDTRGSYNQCFHGLGHALMFATNREVPRALKLCDALSGRAAQQLCYSGVFMENSFSNTQDSPHAAKYIKPEEPAYPCTILDEQYLDSCYRQRVGYLTNQWKGDWKAIAQFCKNSVPPAYQQSCYDGLGQQAAGAYGDAYVKLLDVCKSAVSVTSRQACTEGLVQGLSGAYPDNLPRVLGLCAHVGAARQAACMHEALHMVRTKTEGKQAATAVCRNVDARPIRRQCLDGVQ